MRCLFSLLLLIPFVSFSQHQIKGTVTLADQDQPLSGINIYLKNSALGASTNSRGQFTISSVPEGEHILVASAVGFQTTEQTIQVGSEPIEPIRVSLAEQIMDLPEVVIQHVSMTGGKKGIGEIPGSVHYISPQELEKFNYTDINRILRTIPGVNLQEEDGFGLRPNIGFRGTGVERSSKITVMEDGILMAPAPYAAPAAYYFPTAGRMQAVEIMKGASQIKYGPYTTGGAINFISTQIPQDFLGNIQLLGGSFGQRTLHANVGDSYENVGFMVETFQLGSDGFKNLDGGGDTGFNKEDYLVKFRVNTDANARFYQSLTFKFAQTNETSNETYLGLTREDFAATPLRRYAGSQRDVMNTEQQQLQLRHAISLTPHLDVTTTLYRNNFHRNWYKLDKVKPSAEADKIGISSLLGNPEIYPEAYAIVTGASSPNEDALHVKNNNRDYYAQGIQSIVGYDFVTGTVAHEAEFGIRWHEDQIDRFQWVDFYAMDKGVMELTETGTPGTESNRVETAQALALHWQHKLNFGKLTATPGLRHESIEIYREDYGKNDVDRDRVDDDDPTVSDFSDRTNTVSVWLPGIGLDYQFTPALSTFLGIHRGFSPPGSKEGTLPEESVNYEAGVRYHNGPLSTRAVFFFNDYANLLGSDLAAAGGAGTTQQFNGGEVDAQGLELEVQYQLINSPDAKIALPFSLAYTYTNATFQNNFESEFDPWGTVEIGDELPYLAEHQLATTLSLQTQKFDINLSTRYQGAMRTVAGQDVLTDQNSLASYLVTDVSTNYRLNRFVTFFGSVTNVTDEVYAVAARPAGLRPGMPRAFTLGIRGRLAR